MRELFPVDSESTETSLVLRTEDGEEFFLSITDELREALQVQARQGKVKPLGEVIVDLLEDVGTLDQRQVLDVVKLEQGVPDGLSGLRYC